MEKMKDKEYYISKLKLKPLILNDFLAEFYISENCSWAYYLISEGEVFPFHKILSDSSWQYCAGGPLELAVIHSDNSLKKYLIGPDLENGHKFVHITKPNEWFGARCLPGGDFTLISHCITPPYEQEEDIPGYFREIIELIPEYEQDAEDFSAYKGVNDKYVLNSQTGYR